MNVRSIIALFMGLVIHLSQVQLSLAADAAKSCGDHGLAMTCCDGLQSCPCASEGNPDQKPSPMAPAVVDLKVLVSKVAEPVKLEPPVCHSADIVVSTTSPADFISAYAGVPLSVAFCRFVI
jgi:hypothetical protein